MTFGEYFKTKREEAHITQRDLAAMTGIDHTYISKIEHDVTPPPSLKTIHRICQVLRCDEQSMIIQAGKAPYEVMARRLHHSLNNVIALFVDHKAYGQYTILDDAFEVLAEGAELLHMPLTVSIAEAIDARSKNEINY